MRRILKWTGIAFSGFVVLAVIIGVLFGEVQDKPDSGSQAAATVPTSPPTRAPTAVPTQAPPPTPVPPTPTPTFNEMKEVAHIVSYEDLFRNNEDHVDEIVWFRGQATDIKYLFPSTEDPKQHFQIARIYTNRSSDDIWLEFFGPRLLEGDDVEFVGKVKGLKTYETVLGGTRTVPQVVARGVRIIGDGGTEPPGKRGVATWGILTDDAPSGTVFSVARGIPTASEFSLAAPGYDRDDPSKTALTGNPDVLIGDSKAFVTGYDAQAGEFTLLTSVEKGSTVIASFNYQLAP